MECQQIFIRAEETFRVNTPAEKHLEKIETRNMTMKLMKNTEVVSFYNAVVESCGITTIDKEIKDNLLENMLRLYLPDMPLFRPKLEIPAGEVSLI